MKNVGKKIEAVSSTEVTLRDPDGKFRKSGIWVERDNFYGTDLQARQQPDNYLIVGFDTEFVTPVDPVSRDDIKAGLGKYTVLSYQFHCAVYDKAQSDAQEWNGICYPNDGNRLKLADLLTFAFSRGISSGAIRKIPSRIYLVGHFTRADVPAFDDFRELADIISSVRATFISIENMIEVSFGFPEGSPVSIGVVLRDTMLLTPATSKSLAALGSLVGVPKVTLSSDPTKELFYKQNMNVLLDEHPDLFEQYAINDAIICVRYLQSLIGQYYDLTDKRAVPATLSSIGVTLLLKSWEEDLKIPKEELLGKRVVKIKYYSKAKGRYVRTTDTIDLDEVNWHKAFATECYHGGRNEQFWFGPGFEDDWTDYDLAGAYPTAMAMIGKPDWTALFQTTKIADFSPTTLGLANVDFAFPKGVRFPTLPVRTENGLVFPRAGRSDCSAPEIALAHSLGASLKIRHGVVIPTDRNQLIFGEFIRKCIERRLSNPKGSLKALFWKEVSNSTYGKTAQGLRMKLLYDSRDREMKPLPPSKITNPYYASYITSFVRAALGETINGLPSDVCVFSCTTDGFLTNATSRQIDEATRGPLAGLYRESRRVLTGKADMLEIKHRVRKPLGWRTRGQATLIPGSGDKDDDSNIVLAKGGIYTSIAMDDVSARNSFIVDLFLNREPHQQIPVLMKTGIRDIIEFDADLVDKALSKRLSMEFDWKRRPSAVWQDASYDHVAFSTQPWDTIEEFVMMRRYWEAFGIKQPRCIKTLEDFRSLGLSVLSQSSVDAQAARYMRKAEP